MIKIIFFFRLGFFFSILNFKLAIDSIDFQFLVTIFDFIKYIGQHDNKKGIMGRNILCIRYMNRIFELTRYDSLVVFID